MTCAIIGAGGTLVLCSWLRGRAYSLWLLCSLLQGALLTVSGNNIGLVGGQFLQQAQDIVCNCCKDGCNFAVDIYHSSGVKFRDSVTNGEQGNQIPFWISGALVQDFL